MERPRVPALSAVTTERLLREAGPGPGRLLELGGAGIHAGPFALAGWTVVVADTPERARQARERTDGLVATVHEVDPASLPFADAEFDLVVVEDGMETTEAARVGRRVVR
jgi:Methyltransferase domain